MRIDDYYTDLILCLNQNNCSNTTAIHKEKKQDKKWVIYGSNIRLNKYTLLKFTEAFFEDNNDLEKILYSYQIDYFNLSFRYEKDPFGCKNSNDELISDHPLYHLHIDKPHKIEARFMCHEISLNEIIPWCQATFYAI